MTETTIVVEFAPIRLRVSDLWDPGEEPDVINAQAVADSLNDLREITSMLPSSRRLPGVITVHVPNPSYGGPDSLIPELIPDQHSTSTVQVS